jgi:hypothetical protein
MIGIFNIPDGGIIAGEFNRSMSQNPEFDPVEVCKITAICNVDSAHDLDRLKPKIRQGIVVYNVTEAHLICIFQMEAIVGDFNRAMSRKVYISAYR